MVFTFPSATNKMTFVLCLFLFIFYGLYGVGDKAKMVYDYDNGGSSLYIPYSKYANGNVTYNLIYYKEKECDTLHMDIVESTNEDELEDYLKGRYNNATIVNIRKISITES